LNRLLKIGDEGATACRGAPIFENSLDSDAKYSSTSTTPSSQSPGGLKDEGATACREAPILGNHSQPDDYPESFSGSHLGLTITSTPQDHFVYWKGLEPSELLKYDSRLVAFTQECHTQFRKDNRMHPICARGSSFAHIVDVTSVYPKQCINEIEYIVLYYMTGSLNLK
jgi:hypothetical protein